MKYLTLILTMMPSLAVADMSNGRDRINEKYRLQSEAIESGQYQRQYDQPTPQQQINIPPQYIQMPDGRYMWCQVINGQTQCY